MRRVKGRYIALKALLFSALFGGMAASAVTVEERDAWIAASMVGTTEAYESFLEGFPDSEFADQALEALVDSFATAAGSGGGDAGDAGGGEGGVY